MQATTKPSSEREALDASNSTAMIEGRLFPSEFFWRDHRKWLEDCGYILRPRYQPDWVASWLNTSKRYYNQEDGVVSDHGFLLDATRRSDGAQVILKRIKSSKRPYEVKIGQLFSSEPFASNPQNHCVPIYDALQVPDDKDMVVLVMPFLIGIEEIPFDTLGEAVEFFRQIFEGLQFMHHNHISHRDIKYNNIMMDGLPLYQKPPHPFYLSMKRDFSGASQIQWSRTRKPVKYYLIDFGLSIQYPSDGAVHLEPPGWGGDRTVPEFNRTDNAPCDPFAVDVYCLGNMIHGYFLKGHLRHPPKKGFEFMTELLEDMVKDNPSERPRMDEIVERYATIVSGISDEKLRSRIIDKEETLLERKLNSFRHWCRQIVRRWRRIPAIPSP